MPHTSSTGGDDPVDREVRITVFARLAPGERDPDSLEALRRLITEHPDRVEVYDVTDAAPEPFTSAGASRTAGLGEGDVVEIPMPTAASLSGRAPEHRDYVLAARDRLTAPITITGTDGADKVIVCDVAGVCRWLFVTDVQPSPPSSP